MILSVRNLSVIAKTNPLVPICQNLSFDLRKGESLGILGESGSGKSITALSILQLLPNNIEIQHGEIIFIGKTQPEVNICTLNSNQLQSIRGKEISMIFQEPMSSLNPVITCGHQVKEIISEHLYYKPNKARSYVFELFEKVRLPDPERIYKSYPHQLSGGQKQRVMIAMAIACKPKILIADEPTTALDVSVQKSILDLLKDLQAEMAMSIIFITHDISVVAGIADKIAVMNKGEIVEYDDVNQIIHNPKHPYTKALMECRFSIQNKGERLKTIDDQTALFSQTYTYQNSNRILKNKGTIFELRDIDVSFPIPRTSVFGKQNHNKVLKKINFTVFEGETLGLVGESGSGKTTLGRTILKLIEEQSGNIFFKGKSCNNFSYQQIRNFRQKVQIIFQDPYSSLNPKLTIGDAIKEPMEVHGLYRNTTERKQKVLDLLKAVNLMPEHYIRYPHQFSGGQRQRIGIARALALQPELIVLDESVAALDVSIQAQILNLLNDLKQAYNLTYIFISHDLNTVRYMSDRIIVLKDGEIIEEASAEKLFANPQSEYTKSLLSAVPDLS